MTDPLHTLADLAASLGGVSTKTARRHLYEAMQKDPGLHVLRRGRTLLLTSEQIQRVHKALEWRIPSVSIRTTVVRSVLTRAERQGGLSAQDAVRDLVQKQLGRTWRSKPCC